MPTCRNCGEFVTRDFIRVFGVGGAVDGCPACRTNRELGDGDAATRSE